MAGFVSAEKHAIDGRRVAHHGTELSIDDVSNASIVQKKNNDSIIDCNGV